MEFGFHFIMNFSGNKRTNFSQGHRDRGFRESSPEPPLKIRFGRVQVGVLILKGGPGGSCVV